MTLAMHEKDGLLGATMDLRENSRACGTEPRTPYPHVGSAGWPCLH